ncbi:hypothetical protein Ddye_004190 [Dipteronia dyeriana]|uniref:Nitrate regulatory gene2 protein n=1 Tax=Dipteronia dyeriana TaxID=168575 RepID=A0AAD9XUB3_9ROSI|nr:hypothetical protein Ddye_004190 [Dipteronia dyeriana]
MGCVASKLEEEEEVVSICRERKRQLKLAVERRYALAEAHCRYYQALFAVSAAIKLFVARHSSPSSPFLITFENHNPLNGPCGGVAGSGDGHSHSQLPPPSLTAQNVINNPMFLQQKPNHEANACDNSCECDSSSITSSDSCEEEEEEEESKEEMVREQQQQQQQQHYQYHQQQPPPHCGYYYMQMPPPMPSSSPQRDFGWDFFNPFDAASMRPLHHHHHHEVMQSYRRCSDDDFRAVREEEGIPDLEEEEDGLQVKNTEEKQEVEKVEKSSVHKGVEEESVVKVVVDDHGANNHNVSQQGEPKGLSFIDTPEQGRELLEALKDIEDYFIRASDFGKDVSRMLEINRVHLQSNLEEIKENSTKLMQAITWHRSTSSKPSSCKSLVASSSSKSSTWTEFKNELFDEYGGMNSGSHSSTLERLYVWEKKLYEEVKAGDCTRKLYEKKCSRLRNQDVRGDDELTMDKTRAAAKDLYARILVAIRRVETISKRIQQLSDEELKPQVLELLKGLTQTWKIMLESHETQNRIIFEIKTFASPTFGKFCNDSHRLATLQLEAELLNWRACFTEYLAAQKAYVESLHNWLIKFLVPEVEFYSKGKRSSAPYRANGPPLLVICHDWLASMEKLPDKSVAFALKSFSKDVRALWHQQGDEQLQKRKVDNLAKELDRRTLGFQKTEARFLESKLTITMEVKSELPEEDHQTDFLTEKKDQLDMFRTKLEVEKEKHHNCMQETQRITLNGFQTGFSTVFESLVEFSKASLKMYNDLLTYSENAERAGNLSYIEGSQVEENGGQ